MSNLESPYGIDEQTLHQRALRLTECMLRTLDNFGIDDPWTRLLKNKMRSPEDQTFEPGQDLVNVNLTSERVVAITMEFAKILSTHGYPIASDVEYEAWYQAIQKRIRDWGYVCPEGLKIDWARYPRNYRPL